MEERSLSREEGSDNDFGAFTFLSTDSTPQSYNEYNDHHFESAQLPETTSLHNDGQFRSAPSPDTPHPNQHSRQISESRQLLPSSNLFEYKSTSHAVFADDRAVRESPFPTWSIEPLSLQRSRGEVIGNVVVDLVIISLPLPFYALCGAMVCESKPMCGALPYPSGCSLKTKLIVSSSRYDLTKSHQNLVRKNGLSNLLGW